MADQHLDIQKMATTSLAEPTIKRGPGFCWWVSPKDRNYRYRVTWTPGAVVLTGQLGEIVYRGPTDFWPGPWDAARFIAKCDFDYLTGKSGMQTVYDREATVRGLICSADEEMRYGSRALWTAICKRYSDTWGSDYRIFDANKVTDHMRVAKLLRDDTELSAERVYMMADSESIYYSYPPQARWQFEAVLAWAKITASREPLHSKVARKQRALRQWWRGLKASPPIFNPDLFQGPNHYGGLRFWRLHNGSYRLLMPFRLCGVDLSTVGLWRDQGSSSPADRAGDRFTPVAATADAPLAGATAQ